LTAIINKILYNTLSILK